MILTNFMTMFNAICNNSGATNGTAEVTNMDTANATYKYFVSGLGTPSTSQVNNRSLFYGLDCYVGTGTTEPAASDYAIESLISDTSCSVQATKSENGYEELTFTITGTNSSAEEITITEYLIYKKAVYLSNRSSIGSSSTEGSYPVALVRGLLDTPLTVAAGDSFSVVVTMKLDFSSL